MSTELKAISLTVSPDVSLTVLGFRLDEALGSTYELTVQLETPQADFEPVLLLGTSVTLAFERGSVAREVHGIVARTTEGDRPDDRGQRFELVVMPALKALDQRKNSRIFQEMSIPEILGAVLEGGLQPWGRCIDPLPPAAVATVQEYVVQYQETDLAFVERLMQEHGIGYYFDHAWSVPEGQEAPVGADVEVLVLFSTMDRQVGLASVGNEDGTLPVSQRGSADALANDCATRFRLHSAVVPTSAKTRVFSWLAPTAPITAATRDPSKVPGLERPVDGAVVTPEREMYEHEEPSVAYGYRSANAAGAATGTTDGQPVTDQTVLRRELHRRDALVGTGASTAITMRPFVTVDLTGNPMPDLDGEYYVTRVVHEWAAKSKGRDTRLYANHFEVLPVGVVWRPRRTRPKPRIFGLQTALVVGPAGDEIHTDEAGRIKVQFHWDRDAAGDETCSCFLRVLQSWAGPGWGTLFLPRIGMEVAVTFVDGDPDRPCVTGCFYNGDNTPPYPLPDDKTKSTIKTNSHGADGYNELRFEDQGGSEQVYLRAQRNFDEEVLVDHTTSVGGNETNSVTGDQSTTVEGNRSIAVTGDFDETVSGTETRNVTGDVTESFSANEMRTIGADQTETVTGDVTRTIGGDVHRNIAGSTSDMVMGSIAETVSGSQTTTVAGGITLSTPGTLDVTASGGFNVTAPGGINLVDASYWSVSSTAGTLAGQQSNIIGQQLNATAIKNDFNAILTTYNKLSLMAAEFDFSVVGVTGQATGVDVAEKKVTIESGGVSYEVVGTKIIN